MTSQIKRIPSPCLGICQLDERDLCIACMRSGMEIAEWGMMNDDEKRAVWARIREREALDGGSSTPS